MRTLKAICLQYTQTSIQQTSPSDPFCSLYRMIYNIKYMICLVNPQNGNWVQFTISRNSLYQCSLYRGLSVLTVANPCLRGPFNHVLTTYCATKLAHPLPLQMRVSNTWVTYWKKMRAKQERKSLLGSGQPNSQGHISCF